MLSGVVNVVTDALGDMTFQGDSQNDAVELQSVNGNPGAYLITGTGATLLTLNGAASTSATMTLTGITGNITVNLGFAGFGGGGTFDFEGPTGGGNSNADQNVVIDNGAASNTNIFNNVMIDGNLTVNVAPTPSSSSLSLTSTTVIGNTVVTNADGGSSTTIADSDLEGSVGVGSALTLNNGNGSNSLTVSGTSTFGNGAIGAGITIGNGGGGSSTKFTGTTTIDGPLNINNGDGNNVLLMTGTTNIGNGLNPFNTAIVNGNGGSLTTFAGATTFWGNLTVTNGNSAVGQVDSVTFNGATVQKTTTINNATAVGGASAAQVTIVNSNLGTLLTGPHPVTVTNGLGFDQLSVDGSTIPSGLSVSDDAAGTGFWGSSTVIGKQSANSIGTLLSGLAVGLNIVGDKGPTNVMTVADSTIGGKLNVVGAAVIGNNQITLDSNTIGSVTVTTAGNGNNVVKILGGVIQSSLNLDLASNGTNQIQLLNGSTPINNSSTPVLPTLLAGTITITGGNGTNTFSNQTTVNIPFNDFTNLNLFTFI